jgi:iron complex outermembrane recepter protein
MQYSYKPACALMFACLSAMAQAEHINKDPALILKSVDVIEKRDVLGASLTQPDIIRATTEIHQSAGGVGIVDLEKAREGRVSNFSDTLKFATGVLAQSRFGAEESRLSIRGSGLQRTFHGRGIKLMQDGIPVNLSDGSFDFQAIEPMATRYVEVYRGANALRYGASNLGGAINYVSSTGYDAPMLELRGEIGSFDYRRSGVATGGVIGNMDYFVSSSTFEQDGFRDYSYQKGERTNANIGYRFNEDVETRFYMGYANSLSELPGSLTKRQLKLNPEQPNAASVMGRQRRDIDLWRFANKTTFRFGSSRLEIGAYYSDKTLFHPIFQVLDQDNKDYGMDVRLIHDGQWLNRRNEFVIGYAPSRGTTDENRWMNNNGRRGMMTNSSEQIASNSEFYAENRWYVVPELALITGLQHNRSKREYNDKLFASLAQDESFDVTYSRTSPKLGVLYQFKPSIQFFANVSRSFEPPSFGELAGGLRPNIVSAQKGTTFEIGSRGHSVNVDWDIAAYYARLDNELLQTQVFAAGNNGALSPQTTNAGRTTHAGVEMGMTARLPANLEWRHNFLVNEFRFDNDPTFGDSRLPGIPRTLLRGELMYRVGGIYMGPTIEISPQRYAVDFAENLYNDSYTLFGWKMGQQVNRQLSWFLEGRNLTDRKYASTTSVVFDTTRPGTSQSLFLPGDGRSVYMGVQWRY